MVDLGAPPGGSFSVGQGINASGQVTGHFVTSSGTVHAFLYSAGTGMIDLNTVLPSGSGWTLSTATAINDAGQITGSGVHNGLQRAFLLSPAGTGGNQPAISVSPTLITFPPTLLSTTSSPVQVTVSNTGTANLVISDISTQDPFAISVLTPKKRSFSIRLK